MKFIGRRGFGSGRRGMHGGYLTFHRVDMKLDKTPSVGVPTRAIGFIFFLALFGLVSYGSMEVIQSDDGIERALVLFQQGTEAIIIQAASLRGN
ncbi:MAG: hypothetical protein ACTSWM_06285 [Alphaproteobacteria bacterium]